MKNVRFWHLQTRAWARGDELAALLGGWFGSFFCPRCCLCSPAREPCLSGFTGSSLNGQIPLVSASLGLALSSLTYLPTRPRKYTVPPLRWELQSGRRGCAARGRGLRSVFRALRNLRKGSWVGSGDPINVLDESLGEVGRSLGDLSGVALCSLLGFTGAATGTIRTLGPVTGGVAITRSKVNTRAGRHGPMQPAELGGRSHLRRADAEAIPPLPNRGPSSPPDDPRKRRVTTQGPSGLPQGWGRVSNLRAAGASRAPAADWRVEGLTDQALKDWRNRRPESE